MRSLARAVPLVLLLVAACGEDEEPAVVATPVRGKPFREERVPEGAMLGDVAGMPDAAPELAPAERPTAAAGEEILTFDELAAYEYEPGTAHDDIPPEIAALDGKDAAVEGFMWALEFESGGAKRFLLLKDPLACCFAVVPRLNEWIEVRMEQGAVAQYVPHVPAVIRGTLHVREEKKEGVVTGIYRMTGRTVTFGEAR